LAHSPSRQSLQQPLFVVNNCYIKRSTQSLSSSNNDSTNSSVKVDGESTRRQQILSSQQLPPKMGVKALNHTPINKVNHIELFLSNDSFPQDSLRSPMLDLYQEEKCRRIECEKQNER